MAEHAPADQIPFGTDNLAENSEPRCPCLLLLDTSTSMAGLPIAELNAGLVEFKNELNTDSLAMKRVEVAVVTFGPVKIESGFHTAPNYFPSELRADGLTPIGAAIQQGLDLLKERKREIRANGIGLFKPWVILITDGEPTEDAPVWQNAAAMVREGEASGSFAFFAIGVQGARMDILKQIAVREPLKLQGLKFRELFKWITASMKTVTRSQPGTAVAILPPSGWAEV